MGIYLIHAAAFEMKISFVLTLQNDVRFKVQLFLIGSYLNLAIDSELRFAFFNLVKWKNYATKKFWIKVKSRDVYKQWTAKGEEKQFKMKFSILLIRLLSLACQSKAQSLISRFIVQVAHYEVPNVESFVNRCAGTVISSRHVLAPASCVTPIPADRRIVIRLVAGINNSKRSRNNLCPTKFSLTFSVS